MQDPAAQHSINAAALVVPVISHLLSWPERLTIVLTCMGILWYTIQICEWAHKKYRIYVMLKQSSRRVALPILEDHQFEREHDNDYPPNS